VKNLLFVISLMLAFACNPDSNSKSSVVSYTDENPLTYLDSISDVIVKDPNNSNNYYRRALFFYQEREYDQAMADIERAINIDDSVAEYFYLEGNIYYDDKKIENSFRSYQSAVELDNEHVEAILKLSSLELALENYQLALDMVNKALKVEPMNADGYFLKGFIYLNGGDTATAISSFRTAVEVNSDHYNSYIMLGKLYASEKHEYAGDYYDNALRIRPNSIEALYNKGVYLQSIEEYDEAYLLYDQIIELDSSSYFAYYNRGYMMLISDSSYSGAIEEFEKSLKYYPYYFEAFYNIGLCYENQGDYEKAAEYYKKSLEINPQYDLAAFGLSRLLE
jgi:tetratricopeptide (TPR) repeat protein